jgi:GNAT superfamily N-acetyltransferase
MLKIELFSLDDETSVYSIKVHHLVMDTDGLFVETGKIELMRGDSTQLFYVASFDVAKHFRGNGFGDTLFRVALYQAQINNAPGVHLHWTSNDPAAERIYTKYATRTDKLMPNHFYVEF